MVLAKDCKNVLIELKGNLHFRGKLKAFDAAGKGSLTMEVN